MNLLQKVRENPTIHLGRKWIYGLQCFISGCLANGNKLDIDWQDFDSWVLKKASGFQDWIFVKVKREIFGKNYYGKDKSFAIAFIFTNDSESAAFDQWFDWLDEYKQNGEKK